MKSRVTIIFSILIGLCDSITGLLLMISPVFTLTLMQIKEVPAEIVYMKFIGAFVFSVGSLYLIAIVSTIRNNSLEALRNVWLSTAWIRLVIFSFTIIQIVFGNLEITWISVSLTDLSIGVFQLYWLYSKNFPDNEQITNK